MRKKFCVVLGPKGRLAQEGQRFTMEWSPQWGGQYDAPNAEQPPHSAIAHEFWRMTSKANFKPTKDALAKLTAMSESVVIGSWEFVDGRIKVEGEYRDDIRAARPWDARNTYAVS